MPDLTHHSVGDGFILVDTAEGRLGCLNEEERKDVKDGCFHDRDENLYFLIDGHSMTFSSFSHAPNDLSLFSHGQNGRFERAGTGGGLSFRAEG